MVKAKFGRIGILMGGPSEEREISLKSGKAVYESLKDEGFDVVSIDITTDDVEENIEKIKSFELDVAFIALHGRFGEDGRIQAILEKLKIPYTGSGALASKLALDKVLSRKIFEVYRLNVPSYRVVDKVSFNENFLYIDKLKFPLVVKPATQGSSIGLSIVDNKKDLSKAVEKAFVFDTRIILEEYIKGRELTVGILNEDALPVIEILPKKRFFDYEAKYTIGMTEYIVPAPLDKITTLKVKKAALCAHRYLGCFGFSRIDMILKDSLPYILEVNTIPGLTQTSLLPKAAKAAGITFNQLCIELIKSAYNRI
ncbi:MAG: D-alanine--D-alanine ligase [Candidatus Omnitrophica bacterium]|nr:D-alanine--D-alanine ligase [Candidatus Omnitrophota bacterium]